MKPEDIKQAILDGDDFGFELRVGEVIHNCSRMCEASQRSYFSEFVHGGTYTDSVTGKTRQFDYRFQISQASVNGVKGYAALFAVECKNLHESFPLVVSGSARTGAEAYYDAVVSIPHDDHSHWQVERIVNAHFCKAGDFVGESLHRVRVKKQNNKVQKDTKTGRELCEAVSDQDIYEKWSQALSSSEDLVKIACRMSAQLKVSSARSIVMPVVVVPDGRLWISEYDKSGVIKDEPTPVESCEYFVAKTIPVPPNDQFVLSHVYFVTLSGFSKMLPNFWQSHFSWNWILGEKVVPI